MRRSRSVNAMNRALSASVCPSTSHLFSDRECFVSSATMRGRVYDCPFLLRGLSGQSPSHRRAHREAQSKRPHPSSLPSSLPLSYGHSPHFGPFPKSAPFRMATFLQRDTPSPRLVKSGRYRYVAVGQKHVQHRRTDPAPVARASGWPVLLHKHHFGIRRQRP